METARAIPLHDGHRDPDQRVMLRNVTWEDYERVLAMRGDVPGVRITYLNGVLELMAPSRSHETIKKRLARLIEAYAEELGIDLNGFGSWTIKHEPDERGAEPDECYTIGQPGDAPDLAIEVIWTHGGLDKLEVYRRLGVREVWIWQDGELHAHALRDDGWERLARSEFLPDVDLELLVRFVDEPSQLTAVKSLRAEIRAGGTDRP